MPYFKELKGQILDTEQDNKIKPVGALLPVGH